MVRVRTIMNLASLSLALCFVLALAPAAGAQSVLKQMQTEIAGIVRNARSAVVSIEDMGSSPQGVAAGGSATNPSKPSPSAGNAPKSGTGFSIGEGYVVTTADVVKGMAYPIVITDSGARVRAAVVGYDNDLNVGLVRLLAKTEVPELKLGDSSSLAVGHFAITIGNQSGQDNSVALILVGGLRTGGFSSGEHFYPSLIQIAGTVGAGTSGAPLVNVDSEVVGIMAAVPAEDAVWLDVPQTNREALFFQSANQFTDATLQSQGLTYVLSSVAAKPAAGKPVAGALKSSAKKPASRANHGRATKKGMEKTSSTKAGRIDVVYGLTYTPQQGTVDQRLNTVVQGAAPNKVPVLGDLPLVGRLFQTPARNLTAVAPALHSPVTSAGFAVPINDLKATIEALRAGRPVEHGWLGVDLQTEERTVEDNGIIKLLPKVVVRGIYPDSPAFHSTLQPGDIVERIDDEPILTDVSVRALILTRRPGDEVHLIVRRAAASPTIRLTIARRPEEIKTQPITQPIAGQR